MANSINVIFDADFQNNTAYAASLHLKMTNKSGGALDNPEIKVKLGQKPSSVSNGTGSILDVPNPLDADGIVTLHLEPELLPVENGQEVVFSFGLSFNNGGNDNVLPTDYWVNGLEANGGGEPDTEAPTQPLDLTVSQITSNSANLNWTASTDNIGVTGYTVYYTFGTNSKSKQVSTNSLKLSDLLPGTDYSAYVVAYDAANNISVPSDTVGFTTDVVGIDKVPPSKPINLKLVSTTSSSASLTWEASTDNVGVTGYEVYYNIQDGSISSQITSNTAISITGLTANSQYSFAVLAYDASGNRSELSDTVTGYTSPEASSDVFYAPYIDVTINADWSTTPPSPNKTIVTNAITAGVNNFRLAFICLIGEDLVWGNSSFPLDSVLPLTKIIKNSNCEITAAFGGDGKIDPSFSDKYTEADLSKLYQKLYSDYGAKNIDFDFETSTSFNYQKAFAAAVAAKKAIPEINFSLTLPVSNTAGLNRSGLDMINEAKTLGLDITINIMAMDYGPAVSDMGTAAVNAASFTVAQLQNIYTELSIAQVYKKIAITAMIGQNDSAGEIFTFDDVSTLADFAKSNGLNMLCIWALNRDFPGTGDNSTCSNYSAQTVDYEFSKKFIAALK